MKTIKKYKYHILAFLTPLIIYTMAFLLKGAMIDRMFVISDAEGQYLPTYQYLYNVLHGQATFPYTLTKGIGGSMYGAFFMAYQVQ